MFGNLSFCLDAPLLAYLDEWIYLFLHVSSLLMLFLLFTFVTCMLLDFCYNELKFTAFLMRNCGNFIFHSVASCHGPCMNE